MNPHGQSSRSGVTLTEVLVSLGIMSIGVISLATLFPLSVLRTIQATQLTHATQLRYNAEGLVEAFPFLVHDPDPDLNPMTTHVDERFVVDPLGFSVFDTETPAIRDTYGHNAAGFAGVPTPRSRYGSFVFQAAPNVAGARAFTSLPDSFADYFDLVIDGTDASWDPDGDNLAIQIAPSQIGDLADGDRVVLFHPNAKRSEVRTVNGDPVAGKVTLDRALTEFDPDRVIGQTSNPLYSWLLTCQRSSGTTTTVAVSVAVFFNRKLSIAEEQIYPITNAQELLVTIQPGVAEPNIKAGGYVLDAQTMRWYRIAKVGPTVGNILSVTLAEPRIGTLTNGQWFGIFPERLVDVYPIGNLTEP